MRVDGSHSSVVSLGRLVVRVVVGVDRSIVRGIGKTPKARDGRAIVPSSRARRRRRRRETRVRSSAGRGSFSLTSRASSRGRRRTLSMTRGFERGGRDDARARSSPWTRWSGCGLRLMPESVIVRVTTDWTTAERTNERTVVARVEVRIDVGRRRDQRWGALTRRWRSRRNSP